MKNIMSWKITFRELVFFDPSHMQLVGRRASPMELLRQERVKVTVVTWFEVSARSVRVINSCARACIDQLTRCCR